MPAKFNNIFRNQVAAIRGEIVCISAYFVSLQVYMYCDLFCLVRVSHSFTTAFLRQRLFAGISRSDKGGKHYRNLIVFPNDNYLILVPVMLTSCNWGRGFKPDWGAVLFSFSFFLFFLHKELFLLFLPVAINWKWQWWMYEPDRVV